MEWYQKEVKDVIYSLKTSAEGLSVEEAAKRIEKYGPNELKETAKRTVFMMILDQFKDFMIMVLIAAAVVSGIIGELVDPVHHSFCIISHRA